MMPIARRRSPALRAVLAALLLTACQHSMTASLGGTRTAPSSTGAPGPSVADTRPPPVYAQDEEMGPTGDTAMLIGSTVDEATRLAREKGYAGKIDVTPLSEFQAGCKPAAVCRVSPRLWELLHDKILTLYVNRELTITTPN